MKKITNGGLCRNRRRRNSMEKKVNDLASIIAYLVRALPPHAISVQMREVLLEKLNGVMYGGSDD